VSRNSRPTRAPAKADGAVELVTLAGGPIDGRWFTAPDWQTELASARWHADTHGWDPEHRACAPLRYTATQEWAPHPEPAWPQGGAVWRWQRRPVDE
jgi:hypothetical protein